jgi:hypothetical protein
MLNRDYKEMLQCFTEEGVEYLVVGAYAMAAHGYPRSTGDMDLWIRPTPENAARVYRALAKFGAPLKDISPADFQVQEMTFQIGVAPCRIDVITSISGGIAFDQAAACAEKADLGELEVPVLSRGDLIKNKIATGRPKDMEDADLLRLPPSEE